jgi:hypothetical protein
MRTPVSHAVDLLDEPSPCDACRFAERCRDEHLACDAFAIFAAGSPRSRWSGAPRVPTHERWLGLFEA